MSRIDDRLASARVHFADAYWTRRIITELDYCARFSDAHGGTLDKDLETGADMLEQAMRRGDAVEEAAAREIEQALAPHHDALQQWTLSLVGHAHIDMNWQWGFHETALTTVDTFRAVLGFLDEYPDFVFAQSQASVYEIIERCAPELLPEIDRYVADGRWEITAGQWVETDMNLPSGESLVRHMSHAKAYLGSLFGLSEEDFAVIYLPDTFGHTATTPDILTDAGFSYLYHCRGAREPELSRWVGPSGRELVTRLETNWYNLTAGPQFITATAEYCTRTGFEENLTVFGVGNHGGGPTRRDLEIVRDMATWPLAPRIQYTSYRAWFDRLVGRHGGDLPQVSGERNFIFVGCYSSQAHIKRANRLSEARLYDAEVLSVMADAAVRAADTSGPAMQGDAAVDADGLASERADLFAWGETPLARAWRHTLFNQFHDILPGSGTAETRDHALGLFQEVLADTLASQSGSLRALAESTAGDNRNGTVHDAPSVEKGARGAGAGFGSRGAAVSMPEAGEGLERTWLVANTLGFARTEMVDVPLWDWAGDVSRLRVTDEGGTVLRHQIMSDEPDRYWGHDRHDLLVEVAMPAFGTALIRLSEGPAARSSVLFPYSKDHWLTIPDESRVLENDLMCVQFHPSSLAIATWTDKRTGHDLAPAGGTCFLEMLREQSNEMSAWVTGRIVDRTPVGNATDTSRPSSDGDLRQTIAFRCASGASSFAVTVSLDSDADYLDWKIDADWREFGTPPADDTSATMPQLAFTVRHASAQETYVADIPFGHIIRPVADHDAPVSSFAVSGGIQLITSTGNAIVCAPDEMRATLIRASVNPDPHPDIGINHIHLRTRLVGDGVAPLDLSHTAQRASHPAIPVTAPGAASAPTSFDGIDTRGVVVTALKNADSRDGVIARMWNPGSEPAMVNSSARLTPMSSDEREVGAPATELTIGPLQSITVLVGPNE